MRCTYSSFYDTNSTSSTVQYGIQYTSNYYEEPLHEYMKPTNLEEPKITKQCHNSPVKIAEQHAITIDLPPLTWNGYDSTPRILNITNTGRTILINGHWSAHRPYIAGGPLNGSYIFSQIHFHTPSEHEFEGKRYPLEMHVVHYKSSYLTQERAMNEKDGTVVLVYLFEVLDTDPTAMSSVTKFAPQIEKVNSRTETNDLALEQIVQPFTSNYYIYYGSITSNRNSYLLQWIISGCILCVTSKEADDLLGVMNFEVNSTNLPRMEPQDDVLYYVEEVKCEPQAVEVELLPENIVHECSEEASDAIPIDPAAFEELKQQIHDAVLQEICDELLQKLRAEILEEIKKCLLPQSKSSKVCSEPARSEPVCSETARSEPVCSEPARSEPVCSEPERSETVCSEPERSETVCSEPVCSEPECAKNIPCRLDKRKTKFKNVSKTCESGAESPGKSKKSKKSMSKKTCKVTDVDSSSGLDTSAKESCETKCETKVQTKCKTKCKKDKKDKKKKKKKKKKADECEEEEERSSCTDNSEHDTTVDSSCESCASEKNKCTCKKVSSCETETEKDTEDESCSSSSKTKKKTVSKKSMKKSSASSQECKSDEDKKKDKQRQKKEKKEMKEKEKKEKKEKKERAKKEKQINKECKKLEKQEKKEKKQREKREKKERKQCEKRRKKEAKECEAVCAVSTVTDLTFEDILNFESNWLKENNFADCTTAETSSKVKTLKAADKKSDSSTDIRTLFEKKRDSKVFAPFSNHDIFMSLVTPDNISKTYSLIMTQKELDDLKCLINRGKNKDSKIFKPQNEISDDPLKEFCVQVEVLFRSSNEGFSGCSVQEFNLTLLYNQNVLQEYKGLIYPSKLELGNYETLNLLPTYPEMGCITTQLQNCTVKMDTLDQICMRAKFLLCSLVPLGSPKEDKSTEVLKDMNLELNEAETQCSRAEISKRNSSKGTVTLDIPFATNLPVIQDSQFHVIETKSFSSNRSGKLSKSNAPCETILEGEKSFNDKCKTELREKSETDLTEENYFNLDESVYWSKKKERQEKTDKESPKSSDKELKCLFPSQKKGAFFMCERIEVDKKTGKRIFVGNFRTKDEVKKFYKEKSKKNKTGEKDKLLLFSEKSSMKEIFRFKKSSDKDPKTNSLDDACPSSSKVSGEMLDTTVTQKSTGNKNVGINCFIKDRYNMIVGKPMQLEKTSSSFKRLANLIGMDSGKSTDISVYELQNSRKWYPQPVNTEELSTSAKGNEECTENLNNSGGSDSVGTPKADEASLIPADKSLKVHHKSALLIIPIEVESMSKIEVVLIEHKKNFKKAIKAPNSESIPCLTYNKPGTP